MLDFDQSLSWQALEARLAITENPRHRQLLQLVIDHAKAEAVGDVDGLMASLVADPAYHFWSNAGDYGPKGYDGVRQYYEAFWRSGGAVFTYPMERIVVDDSTICHEGVLTTLAPWEVAKERGYSIPEEDGHYLLRMRVVVFWPFDDEGLALGEDSYGAVSADDFERVPSDELPQVYIDYLTSIGRSV